jgi:hypothetical protein
MSSGTVSSKNLTSLYSNTTDFTSGVVNSSVYSVNGGTGVTVSPTTGNVLVSIGQDVATTANPVFAGATLGNVSVGVATNNTITTSSGALVLESAINEIDTGTTNILSTNSASFLLLNSPTTITAFNGATSLELGANGGTTNINGNLLVDVAVTASNGTFGNVTVGVDNSQTISTSSGNLVLKSTGGEIDTDDTTIISTNSASFLLLNSPTTITAFNGATSLELGANTGTTNINNDLLVDGTITGDSGDFANITIGVAGNNIITTTSGDLAITAVGSNAVNIDSGTTEPTRITRNSASTNIAVRSLALSVQSSGTPAVGFGNSLEYEVETAPGNTERAGYISVISTDLTPGAEDFKMFFGLMSAGAAADNRMSLDDVGNLVLDRSITIKGSTNGQSTFLAPATGSTLSYVLPGSAGAVDSVLTNDGSGNLTWALPGGGGSTFGNITVAVVNDNTISTTTGDLALTATGSNGVTIDSGTTAPTLITRNSTATASSIRSLALAVQSSGTPTTGFGNSLEWQLETSPGNTESAGFISVVSTDLTAASEDFKMSFGLMEAGATYTEKAFIDSAGNMTLDGDLTVNDAVVFNGSTSGSVTIAAPATAGSQSYTLPTALPAVTGYVLSGTTGGVLSWVANPDVNTTYDFNATSTSGGANLNLVGSDATTDTVKLTDGGHITATYTSGTVVTLGSDATDANTASTIVARDASGNFSASGATLDAVTVGIDSAQTISTTSGDLILQTAAGVNAGTITLNAGAAGNIVIAPDTTGDIHLNSDAIRIGDNNATATLATRGTGNLVLTTNEGSGVEGTLTFTNGANGNATFAPNGTGSVANTFNNGGNVTNNRNYITGAIRNATTQTTNGDIWELNTSAAQSATNPYYRGVSIDNSADTTRGPATLLRSYSGGAGAGSGSRGRLIFEKARGTAASPVAVASGDILGSIDISGYSSTGWVNDTIGSTTGFFGFGAAENWVSNTALGTSFNLNLAPTGTTITSGANLTTVLNLNPQSAAYRSDVHTFSQGKTGSMQYLDIQTTRANFSVPVQVPAFLATAVNGTLATTGASGTGTVATLTFGALASAPYIVGSSITVAGVTPAGYNGTYSVTACTTASVSYASTTTGAQTVAGTIKLQAGAVGRQIAIIDSPTVGGRMAFWDTTNARWSYISDNTAV